MGDVSPRLTARIAGGLYLIVIVTAGFAEVFVRGRVIVSGAGASTVANILAHDSLYRLGGSADLVNLVCDTALALLFYELFKTVSRSLSLLAAFFRLMHVAVLAVSTLYHFAPLIILRTANQTGGFSAEQLQAQTLVSLRLHSLGYNFSLVFFGISCMLLGYLIYRSGFLPRIFGVLMATAGLCYVVNSFAVFLLPEFASRLLPWILLPGLPAEWGLTLWLLVIGVNARRWNELAVAAARVTTLDTNHPKVCE